MGLKLEHETRPFRHAVKTSTRALRQTVNLISHLAILDEGPAIATGTRGGLYRTCALLSALEYRRPVLWLKGDRQATDPHTERAYKSKFCQPIREGN